MKSFALGLVLLVLVPASLAVPNRQPRAKAHPTVSTRGRTSKVAKPARPPKTKAAQNPTSDESIDSADVAITATVRADSLKFDVVPTPTVEFFGKPDRITVWEAERENLPTPVQPGVTYRNIGIRLKITSRFRDIDRIVAEALGETPTTDDAAAPLPKPSVTPPTAPPAPPQREHP